MNIVTINHYAGSPEYGMAFRPYYLGKAWLEAGHRPVVIGSGYSHLRLKQPMFSGFLGKETIDGIEYVWIRGSKYKGNGVKRVISIFVFIGILLLAAWRLVKRYRPDIVIASSTYPADIFPAYIMAKLASAKLVYEVHDLWPLTLIELAGFSRWHPFIMFLQFAENFAYRHSNTVVSMLPLTLEHMLAHGMRAEKFTYIPNGIPDEDIDNTPIDSPLPPEHLHAITRFQDEGMFLVIYAGYHGIANSLRTLLHAAKRLEGERVGILLVGQGPEKNALIEEANLLGLKNIVFMPSIPKNQVPNLLKHADLLYLGWQRSALYRFGTNPNKQLDYMLAGKPLLQSGDYQDELTLGSGCGKIIPSENSEALADGILEYMQMPQSERHRMGRLGREFAVQKRRYSVLASAFLDAVMKNRVEKE